MSFLRPDVLWVLLIVLIGWFGIVLMFNMVSTTNLLTALYKTWKCTKNIPNSAKKFMTWAIFHPLINNLVILVLSSLLSLFFTSPWIFLINILIYTSISVWFIHNNVETLKYVNKNYYHGAFFTAMITIITFLIGYLTQNKGITTAIINMINDVTSKSPDLLGSVLLIIIFIVHSLVYSLCIRVFTGMFLGEVEYNKRKD